MRMITGAQIILEVLKRVGVKDIFGYPGGAVIPIYDALYDDKELNHYLARHEQGASHMADAYARVSNTTGVCIATSGPGATNLTTGVMTANMDSIPLLAITGQVGSPFLGKDSFQEAHILGIFTSITKHNYLIKTLEELPQILKEAYQLTHTGRPGPVLVDIPKDLQMDSMPYEEFETLFNKENHYLENKYKVNIDKDKVKTLAELIKNAKKPVLVAGGGVVKASASEELRELIKRTNIPSVSTLMALGAIEHNTPGYLGMIGMHGSFEANTCVDEADLFISIGMRFDDRIVGDTKRFSPNSIKVHIDLDEAEIDKNMVVDLDIIGDAKEVLTLLLDNNSLGDHKEWQSKWKVNTHIMSDTFSKKIINHLSKIMPKDTIITTDVGKHQMFTAQSYEFKEPNNFCTSGGAGTMGFGLPSAIGAQIARPKSKVLSFSGDGGFQMNQQELMLLKQYDIPVKAFIFNNSSLGMVRQWQGLFNNNRFSEVDLEYNPDFLILAKAYGLRAIQISRFEELEDIESELLDNKPLIIEVIVSKDDNVFPIIPAGQSVKETILR